MKRTKKNNLRKWRRRNRVRKKFTGTSERPRLTVKRSSGHIYCQLIDDSAGKTIASASTRDKDIRPQVAYGGNCDAAKVVGTAIADRAKSAGVNKVTFDRGEYAYHGRVASLADAAREGGLEF